jgi:hypothetical protein
MSDVIISDRAISLRKALDEWREAGELWIEKTLALGDQLLAARKDCGEDDTRFGKWLIDNGCDDLAREERKALINLAQYAELTRIVAQEDAEVKPRTLWERVQKRQALIAPPWHSDCARVAQSNKTNVTPSTAPLASISESPEAPATSIPASPRHAVVGSADEPARNIDKAKLVKDLGVSADDYATLFGAYPGNRQVRLKATFNEAVRRHRIAKGKLKALFMIGVNIVHAGKAANLSGTNKFDARIFLPEVPEAITKYIQFEHLADNIERVEAMNAKAAALKAADVSEKEIYEELAHFWQHGRERQKVVRKIVVHPSDSKARIKHEVTFCGELIWPHENWNHITYQDLNAGWHLIDHWANHLAVAQPQKPKEIAVQLRHLILDIAQASSIKGLTDVMVAMMEVYSKHNDDKDAAELSPKAPPGLAR